MYGKIYESTFTGSMVGSGTAVFAVWPYVIANTKPDNQVELNPRILSAILGTTEAEVQTAIDFLCAPDPRSRSKEFKGRRLIKRAEFLYFVPQADKYRGIPNERERRQYFRDKKREQRERLRRGQTVKSKTVKHSDS
jgi:hypothetical protein